jgi:hypothetical protein
MEGNDIPAIETLLEKIDEYLLKFNTTEGIRLYHAIKEVHDLLTEVKKILIGKTICELA